MFEWIISAGQGSQGHKGIVPGHSGHAMLRQSKLKRMNPETIQTEVEDGEPLTKKINHFASWIHLITMICWPLRIKDLLLCLTAEAISGKGNSAIEAQACSGSFSEEKLRRAELEVICLVQKRRFPASQHPVILTKDLHISDLILRHIHHKVGHCGPNHML